jgi:hypothetical protein
MTQLWCFGDSFTGGNGCLPNEQYPLEYKTSEDDLIWPELVSKKLNLKLLNLGYGGYSNDKIIDSIIKSYNFINKNDIVVIGITFYSRFDIPYNNTLITLSPTNLPENSDKLLLDMIPIMDSELLKERHINRINFFKNIFESRGIKCILWELDSYWLKYESIKDATNGKIVDLHWSYDGHRLFANRIINEINKN